MGKKFGDTHTLSMFDMEINVPKREVVGQKQLDEAMARQASAKLLEGKEHDSERLSLIDDDADYKEKLIKREAENYTQVHIMKVWNGWLKAYNHSALIVCRWLDGKLGRRYDYHEDRGRRADYTALVLSIPVMQVRDFVQRLTTAGLVMTEDNEREIVFELGERISQEEMVKMLHENEIIEAKANELILPHMKVQNLKADMTVLLEKLHTFARGVRASTREVLLDDVERRVIKMNRDVILVARGKVTIKQCVDGLLDGVEELYANLRTLREMQLLSAKQYFELAKATREVEDEAKRERARNKAQDTKKSS